MDYVISCKLQKFFLLLIYHNFKLLLFIAQKSVLFKINNVSCLNLVNVKTFRRAYAKIYQTVDFVKSICGMQKNFLQIA